MAKSIKSTSGFHGYILNCIPSPEREKDWGLSAAAAAGIVKEEKKIPSSKDLRESWWTAGDQKDTGSCVGWGTADGVLRWHFVKAGILGKDEPLSVRYLWMASKETDEYDNRPTTFIESAGTWLKAALKIAQKYGVVSDADIPFLNLSNSLTLYTKGDENAFYAAAAQKRISSYFSLGSKLSDWRTWLANNGPILTRLDVDSAWYNAHSTNGKLETYDSAHKYGGHCVSMVGYTPDYFIIRNSWGTSWGDGGFAYAYNDYAKKAFTEAYGVAI